MLKKNTFIQVFSFYISINITLIIIRPLVNLTNHKTFIMQRFILKTIVTSVSVLLAAYILRGVQVDNTLTAFMVAIVMGLLNNFIKPILIILTIPITVFTFGIFLLFINVLIVKWTAEIVPGFRVHNWFWALLFSLIVSFFTSVIEGLVGEKQSN